MPRRKKAEIHRGREAGSKNTHKRGEGVTLFTRPTRDAEGRAVAVYYGKVTFVEPSTGAKIIKNRALKDERDQPITTRPEAEDALAAFKTEIENEYHLKENDEVKRKRAIAAAVKTAEEVLREKQEADRLAQEAKNALRIANAFPRYRKRLAEVHVQKDKTVEKATVDRYEAQFSAFVTWMATNHPKVVAVRDVSPAIAQEWLYSLSGLSGTSRNKRIVLMRSVWNLLGRSVWYRSDPKKSSAQNPWEGAARGGIIEKSESVSIHKEPFTDDEAARLLDLAEGEVKTLAFLAAYTGARLGDCVRFKWDMIDFKNRVISFTPHKTLHTSGKSADVPLLTPLADYLRTLPGFTLGRGLIVPALFTEYEKDAPGFLHKYLDPLYVRAGIETRAERADGKMHTIKAWHSWRHFFATRCIEAGATAEQVRKILGWSTDQMLDVYHHTNAGRLAARLDEGFRQASLPAPAGEVAALSAPKAAPKGSKAALAAFEGACRALSSAGLSPAEWRKAGIILKNAWAKRRA